MRFVRRIFGGDVDEAIRPLVVLQAVRLAVVVCAVLVHRHLGAAALGASETGLGLAYLAMAGSAMVTGVIGGHLSDRVGRRPMMLVGRGFFCLASLGALAAGTNTLAGLSVIVATGALRRSATPPTPRWWPTWWHRRIASRRTRRCAWRANMGVVLGPPIGGLLLAGSWNTLFVGAACLSATSWRSPGS